MYRVLGLQFLVMCSVCVALSATTWAQDKKDTREEASDHSDLFDEPLSLDSLDKDTAKQKKDTPANKKKTLANKKKTPANKKKTPANKKKTPANKKIQANAEYKNLTLDTVSIIGNAEKISRVSGSAHRVSKKQLETEEYDDVHRILKQVPGVYVRDEDGQGLRPNIGLRGANSDRSAKVTLMEDGVLMAPAPYSAPAAYYFPLTTRLTGVEVFKGPAAIKYGPNTIGGAVNLITRAVPRKGVESQVDLSHGMYNSSKVHTYYGQGWKDWGFLLEAARLQTDGFKELDGGGNTGFDKRELMFKLRYNTDVNKDFYQRFDLKLGYADEISNETYLGLSDEDFQAQPYRRYAASQKGKMQWERTQIKIDYHAYIGNDVDIKVSAYRHDFDRSWEKLNGLNSRLATLEDVLRDPGNPRYQRYIDILRGTSEAIGDTNDYLIIGNNQRSYISQGVQFTTVWRTQGKSVGNTLELGVRVHQDEINRNHSEQKHEMDQGILLSRGESQQVLENQGSTQSLSAYLFDELKLGKRWRLTPGIRLESFNTRLKSISLNPAESDSVIEGGELVLLPGLGAWWELNHHWGLLAGAHRGFSPLTLDQTGISEPELSINYEAGTRWHYKKVQGELIGFFNQYQNLVGTCTQSAGCAVEQLDQQFNAGQAHIYGAEFTNKISFQWTRGIRFVPSLTYTWTHAQFQSAFKSGFAQWGEVERGDFLPYVPQHQASLRLPIQAKKWGFGTILNYTSDMRDSASQGNIESTEKVDAQWMLDMNAHYQFHRNGQVYMNLDNILQQNTIVSRRPFGARPGKPFLMRLGLKYTF